MIREFCLWLIWQNIKTRQRYHVGNLYHRDEKYIFEYEHKGYHNFFSAVENGYKPHAAFPDPEKKYVSNELFGAFSRRLPDKRRPDYADILNDLGLPFDSSEMDLLRVTGGRLATDPYEFVSPILVSGNIFNLEFNIAGWRYYDGDKAVKDLYEGSNVKLKLDPINEYDPFAVKIYSSSDYLLGYVPAFYSEFMHDIITKGYEYEATVSQFNPYLKPQLKTKINVGGELNKNKHIKFVVTSV